MKMKTSWIVLLLFSSVSFAQEFGTVYPPEGPFFSKNTVNNEQPKDELGIISYNINFAYQLDQVIEDLKAQINKNDVDVIFLQEVTGNSDGTSNAAEKIAAELRMSYVFAPSMVLRGTDYGNAILSKTPLYDFKKILLPLSRLEKSNQRTAIIASTVRGNRKIRLSSVHLSVKFYDSLWKDGTRVEQLKGLFENWPAESRVIDIVGGDFNSFNPLGRKALFELTRTNGFQFAHLGNDWTMRYLHFRLDHIFVRGPFKIIDQDVLYFAKGSDHVPIWSKVRLPSSDF